MNAICEWMMFDKGGIRDSPITEGETQQITFFQIWFSSQVNFVIVLLLWTNCVTPILQEHSFF